MNWNVTFAFLHHVAAFVIVAVLAAELVLLNGELTPTSTRSVLRMDAAYGIAAALLLVVGFVRVLYTEKGAAYYFHSIPFLVKLSLFLIVGLLSIRPTLRFLSWRRTLAAGGIPALEPAAKRTIRMTIHIELTLLFVIMLCAVLMARGYGYFG